MISVKLTSILAVLSVMLTGCVTIHMPEVAHIHPAHPDAERASTPDLPSLLTISKYPVVAPPLEVSGDGMPAPSHHGNHGTRSEHAGHAMPEPETAPAHDAVYVCPMHPEVVSDQPGECPICFMDLELQED